jgi:diguanylate cyclase (GGDEF)-like protein
MKSLNASFPHPVNVHLVILLVLAAFGLLLSLASWRAYETARETSVAAEANALRFAAAAATYQQSLFDHTHQLLRVLGGISLTQQHDAATCNAFLARQLESFPEYNNLAFADSNGLVWCSARPLPDATAIPGAIAASQKNPRLFSFGRDSAAFTLPYFTLDGRLQGAVLASLPAQTLLPIKNAALPQDAEYGMIDSRGKLIAAYPSLAAWGASDFRFAQTLHSGSAARLSGPDGERFYVSEPVPGTAEELRLIVRLPTDGSGRLASLALLLAALGCTALSWWALGRMLSAHVAEWRAKADKKRLHAIHRWRDKAITLRDKFRALYRGHAPPRPDTTVLRVAYEELKGAFANKEARVRQLVQLDELSQRLQSCVSTAELADAVARCAAAIFPGSSGALLLRAPDQATSALTWSGNDTPHTEPIDPQDCWALRMGRPYHSQGASAAACTHVTAAVNYVCIPLMTRSELLGVLHLAGLPDNSAAASAIPWSATAIAERTAIALAAVRRQERLQLRAIRDALTGLFNRGFLEEALTIEQRRAVRRGSPIGVMMLDVDHFKRFNDTFGHDAGDALLRGMGGILRHTVREGDMPCRYGGEEFVVILPGADLNGTRQRAEVLRAAIEQWNPQHNGRSLGTVTVSVGVAAFPLHGDTGQAVLKMADQALYAAKHAGRNRVAAPKT